MWTMKKQYFSWKTMNAYVRDLNLTSELGKESTLKIRFVFLKNHEWRHDDLNLTSKLGFNNKETWISHPNKEKCELFNFDILSSKLMIPHEKNWFFYLNWEKCDLWKFNIFSLKLMKPHERVLNLLSELGKKWTLIIQYFFIKSLKC